MPRYPKLLPWKARKTGVEDDQAKLLWDYSVFKTKLFGLGCDVETMNDLFDADLKTLGFFKRQVVRALMPCKLCW